MPNKSLGQHWLRDRSILEEIASYVDINTGDTVLEAGPGLGTLTSVLLAKAGKVIAVEYDESLARKLPGQFPGKNLEVIQSDFLKYNLELLPRDYKFVANLPYYITTKIIEHVLEADRKPEAMSLLVQQEVAEKLVAAPGKMSPLSVKLQTYYAVQLGIRVPKVHFTPEPLVGSQVLVCNKRHVALIADKDYAAFERVVRAGFSAPRKKLRSSLAGGLGLSVTAAENMLVKAGLDPNLRAQDLALEDWSRLT